LADAVDIGQRNPDLLVARDVNACNSRHVCCLTLLLFMFGIGADDHDGAFAADDLAPLAARLDGGSDLHGSTTR
jgi:hypothetical protein